MPALAITDHNNVSAAVKFHQAASRAGIKPIQGTEAELPGGYHLTLIARNARGYASLCRLLTRSHLSNPRGKPCLDPNWMAEIEDVLVLSGCRRGQIPALILKGHYRQALECARHYRDMLGKENFYIEMQDTLLPGNRRLNYELMQLAGYLDLEPVATNNVHYAERQDFMVHDLLTCVNHLLRVDDVHPARPLNAEQYLKSGAAMEERFHFCPRALSNAAVIAEQCQDVLSNAQVHFPCFPSPPGEVPSLTCVHLVMREPGSVMEKLLPGYSSVWIMNWELLSKWVLPITSCWCGIWFSLPAVKVFAMPVGARRLILWSLTAYLYVK